jgi:hypothetical protein
MTAKKDLKRRVRERQAETGETYVTARRHVVARAARDGEAPDRPRGIVVEEMLDLEAEGARLGLQCPIMMTASLAARVDPVAVLERVRDVLRATDKDAATRVLRAAVLRGERASLPVRTPRAWMEEARRFITRVRAGLGGLSEWGTLMAVHLDGMRGPVVVIAHVGWRKSTTPRLMLSAADEGLSYSLIP